MTGSANETVRKKERPKPTGDRLRPEMGGRTTLGGRIVLAQHEEITRGSCSVNVLSLRRRHRRKRTVRGRRSWGCRRLNNVDRAAVPPTRCMAMTPVLVTTTFVRAITIAAKPTGVARRHKTEQAAHCSECDQSGASHLYSFVLPHAFVLNTTVDRWFVRELRDSIWLSHATRSRCAGDADRAQQSPRTLRA